jgi:hypothetical protein
MFEEARRENSVDRLASSARNAKQYAETSDERLQVPPVIDCLSVAVESVIGSILLSFVNTELE